LIHFSEHIVYLSVCQVQQNYWPVATVCFSSISRGKRRGLGHL